MTKTDPVQDAPVSEDIGNPENTHDDIWEKVARQDTDDINREKSSHGEIGGVDVGLGTEEDLPDKPKGNLDDVKG